MNTVEETVEIANEKAYTFRTLNSTDLFLMFKIIGKIGINEFTACFDGETMNRMLVMAKGKADKDTVSVVGLSVLLDIAGVICANLPKCEAEIYQMLANTSNLTIDEIKAMEMVPFAEMVIDFVKKDEFKDFIKVASKLFNKAN
jgi:hypothetical protein